MATKPTKRQATGADALAEAFRKAVRAPQGGAGDPGLTREELREVLGIARSSIVVLMRRWHREGRLICGRQIRPGYGIDGRTANVPVYRIK